MHFCRLASQSAHNSTVTVGFSQCPLHMISRHSRPSPPFHFLLIIVSIKNREAPTEARLPMAPNPSCTIFQYQIVTSCESLLKRAELSKHLYKLIFIKLTLTVLKIGWLQSRWAGRCLVFLWPCGCVPSIHPTSCSCATATS